MKLFQTLLTANLPNEKKVRLEHPHITNTMTSRFKALSHNRTEYTAEIEYTKFNGVIPKLMATFLPAMFKKHSQKWLDQFKRYAEHSTKPQKIT